MANASTPRKLPQHILYPSARETGELRRAEAEVGFVLASGPGRPTATFRSDHRTIVARVFRLGFESIGLAAQEVGLAELDGMEGELTISAGTLTLPVMTGRLVAEEDDQAVFLVHEAEESHGRLLVELVAGQHLEQHRHTAAPPAETIVDGARIRSIVRGLVVHGAQARIRAEGHDWLLRASGLTGTEIDWTLFARGGAPISPLVVETSGYSASYELPVLLVDSTSQTLRTTFPRRVNRVRRRRMPRISAHEELRVRFLHPIWNGIVEQPIRDLSDEGIGIEIDPLDDLLCPGMKVTDLRILRGDQEVARLAGVVRAVSVARGHAGLEVRPRNDDAARVWRELVRELLHERTRSSTYAPLVLWDLYEASGYFSLSGKSMKDFDKLKASFVKATKLLSLTQEVGYHVVWPSERGIDAATAMLLAYSRGYLGYHMAKRPGRSLGGYFGKEILREIHWHALERALASGRGDWWIGYVQTGTRFSNLLMPEFQSRNRDAQRECTVPFHAYEISCVGEQAPLHQLHVGVAKTEDVARLCEVIRENWPQAYWRSQDLTPEQMDLRAVRQLWSEGALERERRVFVARNAGVAEAALVAEVGQPGLHVYGLLDLVRFYPLSANGNDHLEALMDAAKLWYASRGRQKFVYFHEGAEPLPAHPDVKDMGTGNLCVISMDLVPDLLDHLFEQMSWDPSESMPPPPIPGRTRPRRHAWHSSVPRMPQWSLLETGELGLKGGDGGEGDFLLCAGGLHFGHSRFLGRALRFLGCTLRFLGRALRFLRGEPEACGLGIRRDAERDAVVHCDEMRVEVLGVRRSVAGVRPHQAAFGVPLPYLHAKRTTVAGRAAEQRVENPQLTDAASSVFVGRHVVVLVRVRLGNHFNRQPRRRVTGSPGAHTAEVDPLGGCRGKDTQVRIYADLRQRLVPPNRQVAGNPNVVTAARPPGKDGAEQLDGLIVNDGLRHRFPRKFPFGTPDRHAIGKLNESRFHGKQCSARLAAGPPNSSDDALDGAVGIR